MAHGTSRLVGRGAELVQLADAVARARRGDRTLVVVEGDAGLGKSRLVSEALSVHRGPEDAVAMAYGVELTGAEIPYRVTSDLLRTLCRDIGVGTVRAAAGWYAPALRPLHPGLADEGDAEVNPARVLPAFVWTLEQLAADRLVWLVVEDLPWVDGPTLDLLTYLVRVAQPGQLLVLVTVRTHDPVADPAVGDMVDSWAMLGGVTRTELLPLDPDQVAELVTAMTGEAATPTQLSQMMGVGHGSPLLTEQLIAAGLDDPDAAAVLEDPMLARIRRLDADTLRLVQLAALGDGHLEHRLLALVYDAPEAAFDAAVDRALQVRLLRFRPEEREYTFAHPLLRKAADGTLTPGQRLRGHRRWGEVLSADGDQRGERRLLIAAAYHWAATDDDTETFAAALRAARETARLGAATETADLLLRAWNLWDRIPNAGDVADRRRDDLFLDTTDALQAADRFVEVAPIIEGELTRTLSDPHLDPTRVLCLRLFADDARVFLGLAADESLYAEALASADELLLAPASRLMVPALGALGWQVRWTDPDVADRLFDRGLEVSLEAGAPAAISFIASQVALQRAGRGQHEEALAVCASALETCRSVADYMTLERVRGTVLAQSGRLRAGLAQLDRSLDRLPDPQLAPTEWSLMALNAAAVRIWLGEWEEAAALLVECHRLEVEEWSIQTWVDTHAAEFACLRGEMDEAARLAASAQHKLGPAVESLWDLVSDPVRMVRARLAAHGGDYVEAHQLLEPMLSRPGMGGAAPMWPMAGLAAEIEGDRAASAQSEASAVESIERVDAVVEALPTSGEYLSAWHRHARSDLARARHEDSADAWVEVCDGWRAIGHVSNLAWASYRLAGALVREDDKKSAEGPLAEAWTMADQLGAMPLRDAALELSHRARIPISGTGGNAGRGTEVNGRLRRLTERELEVLRHVAAGMSNNEIAESLFISPRTASVHVSAILAKLNVASRTKAATVALEEGLDVHRV